MSEKRNKQKILLPKFDIDKTRKFINSLESFCEIPANTLESLILGSFVYNVEDITLHRTKDFSVTVSMFLEQCSKMDCKKLGEEIDNETLNK